MCIRALIYVIHSHTRSCAYKGGDRLRIKQPEIQQLEIELDRLENAAKHALNDASIKVGVCVCIVYHIYVCVYNGVCV
jgi:hypothetical protein